MEVDRSLSKPFVLGPSNHAVASLSEQEVRVEDGRTSRWQCWWGVVEA